MSLVLTGMQDGLTRRGLNETGFLKDIEETVRTGEFNAFMPFCPAINFV